MLANGARDTTWSSPCGKNARIRWSNARWRGIYRLLAKLTPFPIPTEAGDFCLLDKKVVAVMNALPERSRYLRGLRRGVGSNKRHRIRARGARRRDAAIHFKKSSSWRWTACFLLGHAVAAGDLSWPVGVRFRISRCGITLVQKLFAGQFAKIGLAPGAGFPTIVISIPVPRRRPVDLPRHPGRIHRTHLRRSQRPSALDHPRPRRPRVAGPGGG